jgi:hypothetical protein
MEGAKQWLDLTPACSAADSHTPAIRKAMKQNNLTIPSQP